MAECDCLDDAESRCLAKYDVTHQGVTNTTPACLFPFAYKHRLYSSCTTAGHNESWCATSYKNAFTREADTWGPCSENCFNYQEIGPDDCMATRKNGTPQLCQFPFRYKGKVYKECILDDHHKPWCATGVTSTGDLQHAWGECHDNCPGYAKALDRCLSVDGWPCIFPFTYHDRVYHGCTYADHNDLWCSIGNFANGTMARWKGCEKSDRCKGTLFLAVVVIEAMLLPRDKKLDGELLFSRESEQEATRLFPY